VRADIQKILKRTLDLNGKDENDLVAVHSANNWNDVVGIKEDLQVLQDEIAFMRSQTGEESYDEEKINEFSKEIGQKASEL
jgi:hypothetical protein